MSDAMTVKELIETLSRYDDDTEVYIAYEYGDRLRTQVAEPVEVALDMNVEWSEYHRKYKVPEEPGEDEEVKNVIVLGRY